MHLRDGKISLVEILSFKNYFLIFFATTIPPIHLFTANRQLLSIAATYIRPQTLYTKSIISETFTIQT